MYTYHTVAVPESPVAVDFASPSTVIHHNLLTEWQVDANNPDVIDISTRREIFRQAHVDPLGIHNGGMLEFGPDGYLYGTIGTPTGSGSFHLYSQDLSKIEGKIFRIDPIAPEANPASTDIVSANGKYRIPADNPYVNDPNAMAHHFRTVAGQ